MGVVVAVAIEAAAGAMVALAGAAASSSVLHAMYSCYESNYSSVCSRQGFILHRMKDMGGITVLFGEF